MTPTVSVTTTSRTSLDPFMVSNGHGDHSGGIVPRKTCPRPQSTSVIPRTPVRSSSDSGLSSDCDVDTSIEPASRGRSLDRDLEHKLHEAVSSIKVTRSMSPEEETRKSVNATVEIPDVRVVTASNSPSPASEAPPRPGHTKSASLYSLGTLDLSSRRNSDFSCAIDSDADEYVHTRPHRMVRKKSGELVRSSLKSGGRRPASMPSTPVFTKNVKFDRKLEHIRHFLHSEKPAAVSANTSPTQEYATNSDFPMRYSSATQDDFELSIDLPNFVPEAQQADNEGAIIKVETVYLSSDKSSLIGRVAVRNLAFHKQVHVRYTLDHWRTTSDTAAEYTEDVRKKQRDDPFDRFLFRIKIDDFTGVTEKLMFFCVRYHTAGQDFWDSNGGQNFRVEFHKRPAAAERRHSDPPLMAPIRRPSSDEIDVRDDDIALKDNMSMPPLRSPRSLIFENIYDNHPGNTQDEPDHDKPVTTRSGTRRGVSADSFSNRYDFGASLTAAIAAANSMLQGSGDEIMPKRKQQIEHVEHVTQYNPYFAVKPSMVDIREDHQTGTISPSFPPALESFETNSPTSSGNASPVPGISVRSAPIGDKGQAYQTLLDNYCFFQPKPLRPAAGSGPSKVSKLEVKTPSCVASPYDTPPYSTSPPQHHSPLQCGRSALNSSPMNYPYEISSTGSNTPIQT